MSAAERFDLALNLVRVGDLNGYGLLLDLIEEARSGV